MRHFAWLAVVGLFAVSLLPVAHAADLYWDINGAGVPALGDYNNDGKVDAADYVVWRKTDGTNASLPNDNGLSPPVGPALYTLWRSSYGNSAGGAGGATPDGSWDSATANWSTNSAGTTATQVWNPGDVAVFSAGSDATGAYTVTIDSQTAGGIRHEDGDVTITGGALQLTNGSSINVLSGHKTTMEANLINNTDETISKDGGGTLVLSNANSLFGTFTLNSGTIGIGNLGAFGATAGSSTLNINGGNLTNATTGILNVSPNLKVNINGDFSADDSLGGNLISFGTSGAAVVNGGGVQVLTGNRTITVNGPPATGSFGAGLRGLSFQYLAESGGSYGIVKRGTGTLRFEVLSTNAAAADAFTGDVTVEQGVLEVSATGWIGKDGANTIRMAGGSFNATASRNASNPINNPFVITADTKFTSVIDNSFTGTTSVGFFGGFSSPNNSKITFENTNPNAPQAGDNTSCPQGNLNCTVFNPRFAGATSVNYAGEIEIKNHATITNQLTRLSMFNTTGSTTTFSGVISGNGQFTRSATVGGTGGITILTGANTISGAFVISDGTLYINNTSGSGTGTATVGVGAADPTSFYNGGTGVLAGNGSMTSPITVWRSGVISPGTIASPITALSGGSLTFANENSAGAPPANYAFDFNSSLAVASGADLMNVNGNLSFGAGGGLEGTAYAELSATDLASTPASLALGTKFTLFSYSGTWDGGEFNGLADDVGTITVGSNTFRINYNDTTPGANLGGGLYSKYVTLTRVASGSGSSDLINGAIPEPASAILMLLGFVPFLWRRNR